MARFSARGSKSLDDLSRALESGDVQPIKRTPTQLTAPTTLQEHQALEQGGKINGDEEDTPNPRSNWPTVIRSVIEAVRGENENADKFADMVLSPDFQQKVRDKRRNEPLAGIPALADLLSNDERFLIFRGFNYLQTRLILEKQSELRQIETDLCDADYSDSENTRLLFDERGDRIVSPGDKPFTRHRKDPQEAEDRRKLFDKAENLFNEYSALLTAAHQLRRIDKPARHERKLIKSLVEQVPFNTIARRERDWVLSDDLITLGQFHHNSLLAALLSRLVNPSDNGSSHQRFLRTTVNMEALANLIWFLILSILIPVVIFVPIYALAVVGHNIGKGIGVLIASTIVFFAVIRKATGASAHELWTGTAAYLAVLVVFLGNNNN